VAACLKAVAHEAGRIDVLVNNAAYELRGAIEETSIDEAKAQFETNFFEVVRLVQAVLPSMRRNPVWSKYSNALRNHGLL
jgi:NAD(P)-dependent dehydrogenase (short-subunit alcohol dehydrogenase family)